MMAETAASLLYKCKAPLVYSVVCTYQRATSPQAKMIDTEWTQIHRESAEALAGERCLISRLLTIPRVYT
ncbi:MAG: hypothetical protein NVS9B15_17760 [Acidobacteriaceae bacterium]